MKRAFPPPNQRKLNATIKELYGERYADWYDLAMEMYHAGGTYQTITERFAMLGVSISIYTVSYWLKERWDSEREALQITA